MIIDRIENASRYYALGSGIAEALEYIKNNDLGNIAIIRKQLGVAEGHFAKAVTLNPQYDVARNNLSQVRALLAAVPTESSAQNP